MSTLFGVPGRLGEEEDNTKLEYNHAGPGLAVPFQPGSLCMVAGSGRVYHPAPDRAGGAGLVADRLSILWTGQQRFTFGNGEESPPTGFHWQGREHRLDNALLPLLAGETE